MLIAIPLFHCHPTIHDAQAKVRPSTPNVARQFIINKNCFEFGPLLIGKDATGFRVRAVLCCAVLCCAVLLDGGMLGSRWHSILSSP